jgi:hypothetical protein
MVLKPNSGKYPSRITVVGWDFKLDRFSQLHRAALAFPASKFRYIAPHSMIATREMILGEQNAASHFVHDPYGCGTDLMSKKISRNPLMTDHGYEKQCPALSPLLDACTTHGLAIGYTSPWATISA